MNLSIKRLIIACIIIGQSTMLSAQRMGTLFCPKSGIGGFEAEAQQAKSAIGDYTSDLNDIKVYVTTKGKQLYVHSNYKPEGASYPYKIATDEDITQFHFLLKYLTDPYSKALNEANPVFDRAYQESVVAYVDASLFANPTYKKMDWGEIHKLNLIDDETIFITKPLSSSNAAPVVEAREGTYISLVPDEACDAGDYISAVKKIILWLNNADSKPLEPSDVSTNSDDERIKQAAEKPTYGQFFDAISSSGLTLVDMACKTQDNANLLVFGVYKQPTAKDVALDAIDKITEVDVKLKDNSAARNPEPSPDTPHKDDSPNGWQIFLGIVVLLIIINFFRQKT
jgi:hypothetical protein